VVKFQALHSILSQ